MTWLLGVSKRGLGPHADLHGESKEEEEKVVVVGCCDGVFRTVEGPLLYFEARKNRVRVPGSRNKLTSETSRSFADELSSEGSGVGSRCIRPQDA